MKKLIVVGVVAFSHILINCCQNEEVEIKESKVNRELKLSHSAKYEALISQQESHKKECSIKKRPLKYSAESLSPINSFLQNLNKSNPKLFVKPHKRSPNNYEMRLPNELMLNIIKMAILTEELINKDIKKINLSELNANDVIPLILRSKIEPDKSNVILNLLRANPIFSEYAFDALKIILKSTKISDRTLAILISALDSTSPAARCTSYLQKFGAKKLKCIISMEKLGNACPRKDDNIFNRSDLTLAASLNSVSALKVLIEQGFDVNKPDVNDGSTPLMSAAINNNFECAKILLESGSNVFLVNNNRESALSLVGKEQEEFFEMAELLMQYLLKDKEKAKKIINLENKENITPLIQTILNNHSKIVELLVKNGADVNKHGDYSPLMYAIQKNNFDICKILVSAKSINLDYQNSDYETALIHAARNGNLKIVKLLINQGANVNLKDFQDFTASSYTKNPEILKILNSGHI